MDKEVIKLIHRANQLTKQNMYCIISSARKNNFMESDQKKYCQIFLPKLILTNFRTQRSKPSLPHQLFFELPPGLTYLIQSVTNNSSHNH